MRNNISWCDETAAVASVWNMDITSLIHVMGPTQWLPLVPIQDQWCIGCDAKNIFPQRISNKNTKYSIYKYVLIYLPKLIKSWYLKKSWIKVDKTIDNVDR